MRLYMHTNTHVPTCWTKSITSPAWRKKKLLYPSPSFFLCCSLVTCLFFPSIFASPSLSLSPPHSLFALGSIVIIKAKEYLRVLTPSISLSTLWPAIISHTHTRLYVQYTHEQTNTRSHTHTQTGTSSCDWITFWLIVLLRAKQW